MREDSIRWSNTWKMKREYIEIRLYQESVKAYVGALGCLFCAGYFRPRLREYLRKYAECVMDFKNDLAVRRYIEMKVEKFPFLMLSGSSICIRSQCLQVVQRVLQWMSDKPPGKRRLWLHEWESPFKTGEWKIAKRDCILTPKVGSVKKAAAFFAKEIG